MKRRLLAALLPLCAVALVGMAQPAGNPRAPAVPKRASFLEQAASSLLARHVEAPGGGVLTVPIDLPGRIVQAAVWKAQVGLVPVLLLDTDIPLNDPADRPITGILYARGRAR